MQTTSITVMNLCVPCENRCRYCLLSYNGTTTGVDYKRSETYAEQFYEWIKANRPDLSFTFGFGYSMEHPALLDAIDFCRRIGSVTGEFLQFDGMKFRSKAELTQLLMNIQKHGIKLIDLTFYGIEEYHDKFAARKGDYRLMMDTLEQANHIGLDVSVSIPLTHENAGQIDKLLAQITRYHTKRISCFVPHSEGRGRLLDKIRFSADDYDSLSSEAKSYFNSTRFKTEQEWLQSQFPVTNHRALTITLTPENIDFFERMDFGKAIQYLEQLDDTYYSSIPNPEDLARMYGDPRGQQYYSARDLQLGYQRKFIEDNHVDVYDIHDERQCFARRF